MTANQKFLTLILAAFTGACTSVPEPFSGTYPDLQPSQASPGDIGRDIRWGGVILDVKPDARKTCFEILSRALARDMRPQAKDQTEGRFIACKNGFHDPEVFTKGREITLTGRIGGIEGRKVGEFEYNYPIIEAQFMTMWPERPDLIVTHHYNGYYDPWYWGPYYRYPRYRYPYGPQTTVRTGRSTERVDLSGNQPKE